MFDDSNGRSQNGGDESINKERNRPEIFPLYPVDEDQPILLFLTISTFLKEKETKRHTHIDTTKFVS